uniref:hypothetical protein n=1 Tax=Methylibium rhizosphaerae TaxID=2570323 RepID=UPI001C6120C0
LTFDMSGSFRLAGNCSLDGGVRRLLHYRPRIEPLHFPQAHLWIHTFGGLPMTSTSTSDPQYGQFAFEGSLLFALATATTTGPAMQGKQRKFIPSRYERSSSLTVETADDATTNSDLPVVVPV